MNTEAALRDRIAELEERIRQLEKAFAPEISVPDEWCLTALEGKLFRLFAQNRLVTIESFLLLYYGFRDEPPATNMMRVLVSNLRHKLGPFGVHIDTVWGLGYRLRNREQFALKPRKQAR